MMRLNELHQPVIELRCGARFTAEVKHYSGRVSERNLICTKVPHTEGDHQDALCCWAFHRFPFESAEPNVEDVWQGKNCSCGYYECKTRAALDAFEQTGEAPWLS
ncbi:hypothetical protein PBI_DEWDROP_114 [Microbacterium phage Dewdrop]|nr:hypothetical protein PBI_LEAF_114 [Microbacterium phage Leaf]QGZ17482.1 hypothetical protein PBI_DEWDROP_114 [Microbacterium phage Dewdrop]